MRKLKQKANRLRGSIVRMKSMKLTTVFGKDAFSFVRPDEFETVILISDEDKTVIENSGVTG